MNSITMKYWPVLLSWLTASTGRCSGGGWPGRASFRMKRSTFCLSIVHLLRKHLDRDHLPGPGVVAAVHAAEAARRDLVEDAVAAEEVPVEVALDQFVRLPGREVLLPLHEPEHLGRGGLLVVQFAQALAQLGPSVTMPRREAS